MRWQVSVLLLRHEKPQKNIRLNRSASAAAFQKKKERQGEKREGKKEKKKKKKKKTMIQTHTGKESRVEYSVFGPR